MSDSAGRTPSGRGRDAGRRDRLIAATERVLAARGLEGLTARAIAAEAEVPLSSITYHFATVDSLLEAAFVANLGRDVAAMRATLESIPEDGDVIAELARYLADFMHDGDSFLVTSQLWVAAVRRAGLREQAAALYDEWRGLLAQRIDPLGAAVVAAVILGTNQRELASDSHPSAAELEALLRRAAR